MLDGASVNKPWNTIYKDKPSGLLEKYRGCYAMYVSVVKTWRERVAHIFWYENFLLGKGRPKIVGYGDVHGQLVVCYVTQEAELQVWKLMQKLMGKL